MNEIDPPTSTSTDRPNARPNRPRERPRASRTNERETTRDERLTSLDPTSRVAMCRPRATVPSSPSPVARTASPAPGRVDNATGRDGIKGKGLVRESSLVDLMATRRPRSRGDGDGVHRRVVNGGVVPPPSPRARGSRRRDASDAVGRSGWD